MTLENRILVGQPQRTDGANGLITSALVNGDPTIYCTEANVYAKGCKLYERDGNTGGTIVTWENTGTAASPSWTSKPSANLITISSAIRTMSQEESGSVSLLDKADGITVTLPAPVVGTTFEFLVKTSITSNALKFITDAGTTLLVGTVIMTKASDGTMLATFGNGTTHIAISCNGSTTGALVGSRFKFTCISATLWLVEAVNNGSSIIATPFATS